MQLLAAITTMPIFGDRNSFAISCKLSEDSDSDEPVLIWCHYLIAGDFIGNEDEPDHVGTCAGDLERALVRINNLQIRGHELIFDGLPDREALEIVQKANQLEKEFESEYMHLLQQPNEFWYAHWLTLAESTDKAFVIMFNHNGNLRLVKQPYWDEPRTIKSVICDFEHVTKSFRDCQHYLKIHYPVRLSWLQL